MTIYGWDASHYDAVPAGSRVVSEGFAFMTHKAGGDANDAELSAWWAALKPYRSQILLGAYWVLYPGNPAGRADAFIARLDAQCSGWRDGPFILQLDCEDWTGDGSTKPGRSDIRAACDRLRSKMPKLMPIVYASAGQYGDSLDGLGYPLWNARYPSSAVGSASGLYLSVGGDTGKGWARYSGQTPAIWQFTSSATIVGQTTCDANAYRGTLAQLTNLVAPGWHQEEFMAFIDDQNAFNAALAAAFGNGDVRNALGRGVWGYDPGTDASTGQGAWPGVQDPWHPGETIAPGSALGAVLGSILSKPDAATGPVNRIAELKAMLTQVLTALAGTGGVDVTALAAALAPMIEQQDPAQLKDALIAAFREMAGGQ